MQTAARFIFILNIYLLNLGFFSMLQTLSFQVTGMVLSVGFQKLHKKSDSIKRTAPHAQGTPTNKTHLHNHQIISPASETARFGGLAVPLSAAQGGGFVPIWLRLTVSLRLVLPLLPLRRHPKCVRPVLYSCSLGVSALCFSSSLGCASCRCSRRCS